MSSRDLGVQRPRIGPRWGDAPFVVSSSDWDDLRRPRHLSLLIFRGMPSAGASREAKVVSRELA